MTRRTVQFLLFFSIVFTLYTILNSYIFIRGLGVVPPEFHRWYIIGFVILAYSFWWGRLLSA